MLKKMNDFYFLKLIFSFIEERKTLIIIKYNKSLLNKLNINSIYFKILSGKYIIFGENGFGKEYSLHDTLLFEGKYLNGKRYGKGKE